MQLSSVKRVLGESSMIANKVFALIHSLAAMNLRLHCSLSSHFISVVSPIFAAAVSVNEYATASMAIL
jgi:hypothetical protein